MISYIDSIRRTDRLHIILPRSPSSIFHPTGLSTNRPAIAIDSQYRPSSWSLSLCWRYAAEVRFLTRVKILTLVQNLDPGHFFDPGQIFDPGQNVPCVEKRYMISATNRWSICRFETQRMLRVPTGSYQGQKTRSSTILQKVARGKKVMAKKRTSI